MILVVEANPDFKSKWIVRVVLELGDYEPRDVSEVRDALQKAVMGLPKKMGDLVITRFPDKRRKDA